MQAVQAYRLFTTRCKRKWADSLTDAAGSPAVMPAGTARTTSSAAPFDYSSTSALLECLVDHEKRGVPPHAGADGPDAFELVRAITSTCRCQQNLLLCTAR